jgi:predicted Rossmann fold nucleotide-binding protein DprA/Smf involved in DNA uptake
VVDPIEYIGNKELLKQKKTAFLASSTIPPDMVLRCYDWAAGKREGCVVSGFSSKLEKDVLHFLLKAHCPIILVLARKMYKVIPEELKEALEQERLLIISTSTAVRQSKVTALSRNRYICELADEILFVGVNEKSSLYPLKEEYYSKLRLSKNELSKCL